MMSAVQPAKTPASFRSIVVVDRAANTLKLYHGRSSSARFRVATGQSIYPTPSGVFEIVNMQREPVVDAAELVVGAGPEARPARPGQPARHALDGHLVAGRRHARHARRRVDRLLALPRLHPHAHPRRRVAVRPRRARHARHRSSSAGL